MSAPLLALMAALLLGGRAGVAVVALMAFREDLGACADGLALVLAGLRAGGYELTPVRALEVLVWTQVEPHGYYRDLG